MIEKVARSGVIYITTTCCDGLIKIGIASEARFEDRMRELEAGKYGYGITQLKRYFAVLAEDYENKEKLLQRVFADKRIGDTEFFVLDKLLVKDLLLAIGTKQIYPIADDTATTQNQLLSLFKF